MKIILSLVFLMLYNSGFSQTKFDLTTVEKFQKELNAEYSNAKTSPLMAEDLASFKTLDFYPINKKFYVVAKLVRTPKEKPFKMKTSTNRKPVYVKYGEAHFVIDGENFKLNIYRNMELSKQKEYKNDLFLPFSDLTSGTETYIGGRYMDLKIPNGDTIVINFNTSYNPYCAYNYKFSCPKVPLENNLNIKIEAGVKKFHN